jgi:hypothetical protein
MGDDAQLAPAFSFVISYDSQPPSYSLPEEFDEGSNVLLAVCFVELKGNYHEKNDSGVNNTSISSDFRRGGHNLFT